MKKNSWVSVSGMLEIYAVAAWVLWGVKVFIISNIAILLLVSLLWIYSKMVKQFLSANADDKEIDREV